MPDGSPERSSAGSSEDGTANGAAPATPAAPPEPPADAGPERCVGHVDCDAFFAAVELLRRPELRGKPVIVAHDGPRSVVTTATYEARKHGVGSAMPLVTARRRCPDAILVPPDLDAYREASQGVMAIIRDEVEVVQQMSLDEAYVDLTGMLAPRAAMRRLVTRVKAETSLDVSVGIGPNKLVAKLASDAEKPRGFVVLDRRDAWRRWAGESPGLLPGIGPKTALDLERRGVGTIRALSRLDEPQLSEWYGPRTGPWLWRRCRFDDRDPVVAVREPVSESRETTFSIDLDEIEDLERELRRLAIALGEALERQGRRGRTVGIKVRLADFTTVTRSRTLPTAIDDPEVLAEIAVAMLLEYAPAQPVRLLGVRAAGLELIDGPGAQLTLPLESAR
ncbi:DNA polymerase IV [Patulibacter medicamentivorans]|uniref:DNA polymerase IV n=1 Tax=Patulibacter medicamentivorans TaxID=1097667 RepID=UPI00147878DF|nr:DNA polymerase IV [Patulibacter medicamentivorans]